jgi:hypothetical protein
VYITAVRRRGVLTRGVSWFHVPGAVAYVGVLAAEFSAIAAQLRFNSDVAGPVLLGNALAHGTLGRPIGLDQPAYMWAFAATSVLGHQQIVLALLPLLVSWIGLAAIIVAVARVAGRWPASLALALGVAAPPLVLLTEMAPAFHGLTWCFTGLLGLFALGAARHHPSGRWLVVCLVVGIGAGAAAATDILLIVTGLAPLVVVALWLRYGPARLAAPLVSVVVLGASAGVAFVAVHLLLDVAGYSAGLGGLAERGALSSVGSHAQVVARGLLDLTDGLSTSDSSSSWLTVVPALGALTIVLLGVASLALRVLRHPAAVGGDDGDGSSSRSQTHLVYWLTSGLLTILLLLVSNVITPEAEQMTPAGRLISAERFLPAVFFAAVALLPLWPRRPRTRVLAAVLAGVFVVASGARMAAATTDTNFQPDASHALPTLQTALLAHGLTRGYASYWVALPLQLSSDGALDVLPAAEGTTQCGGPSPDVICRDLLSTEGGWYTPHAGRSFVVVDPTDPFLDAPPPAALGSPMQTFSVGRFSVYVYAHDVLSSFASTCAGRVDHLCNP